jgi:tetratricopeptide (TPR) repeat protein
MVKGYERFATSKPAGGNRPVISPFTGPRGRWATLIRWGMTLCILALVVSGVSSLYRSLQAKRKNRMHEPEVVDAGGQAGFLSRIFNIQIEYDDRLDEEAKLELSRGKRLLQDGQYLEAVSCFDNVLEPFPRNGDALFFRAQSLYRVGLIDRAAEDVLAVLRRYPDDVESLVLHADLMSQLDKDDEARASLKRVERLQPTAAYVRRVMARAYRQVGEWHRSRQLLERLLHENPRDAASSYEMSLLLSIATDTAVRNPREALYYARRALRESPENWAYGEAAACALAADGRFAEAVLLQQHVVDVAPKWAWKDCAQQLETYRRSARQQVTAPTSIETDSRRGANPTSDVQ